MSSTTDARPEVATYLTAVRETLSDLPPAERDDLLAEVESSLQEAADEGGRLHARLGSPEEFALELRSAAGLHERARSPRRAAIMRAAGRFAGDPRLAAARRLATQLAPIWWLARAYLAVAGAAAVTHSGWSTRFPAVPRFGSAAAGVAAILVAAAASVALGLRARDARLRRGAIALNVVCVVLAVPVVEHLGKGTLPPPTIVTVSAPYAVPGLLYNGQALHNIYPYTLRGKLLHDVLLYDEFGHPIDLGAGVTDPNRRVLTTSTNTQVLNSFPIRYYDPGTIRVTHPNAGPAVHVPHVVR
ncbi:MAG: HAAS signaling domain-containing protein [Thermoleophilaceae bacterium]